MSGNLIRQVVSSAGVMMVLAAASGASAQDDTQIRAERPLSPNESLDFQAEHVSVHAETSSYGAKVTTTVPADSKVRHAVDIVLSCSDGTAIFNDLEYTSEGTVATQDCDPGAELFLAEVSIHLME